MICRKCSIETDDHRPNRKVCRTCERLNSRLHIFKLTRGITHYERDQLLEHQGGVCASCGSNDPGSIKGWHVDHCHKTNTIRGVLCATCNIALGQVNDSIPRLEKLIKYLRKSNDYLERE